jgi:hypothetical protein
MAERPLFIPVLEGPRFVRVRAVSFQWFPGLSFAQKQRSADSLHAAARQIPGIDKVLEISSKSREDLGVALSAFNLSFTPAGTEQPLTVECAFQGSKVFAQGGPYTDLFSKSSRDAKRDERLRGSGPLVGFRFLGADWALEPKTAFYDWLYLQALDAQPEAANAVTEYSAFTDIEFNPEKSLNCQASRRRFTSRCGSVACSTKRSCRGLLS